MGYRERMDERAGTNQQIDMHQDTDEHSEADPSGGAGDERQSAVDHHVDAVRNIDDDVRRTFERSLYDVHLPDGTVTLLVRRAPLGNSGPIRDRRLAIVTAYNPGRERPGEAANCAANQRLRAEIERRGRA